LKKVGSGKTVLLVDDDERIRRMLSFLFLARGFKVEEAENGADAFELLSKSTPDVIIVDFMMPVMDGFEFCNKIKDNEDYNSIPLIILSALSADEYKIKIEALDIYRCFEKPFRSTDILQTAIKAVQNLPATE